MHGIDSDRAKVKVRRLVEIAAELRGGQHFEITRLTLLKEFCADPIATAKFGLYLTRLARAKAKKGFRPLIDRAVRLIQSHVRRPGSAPREALWATFHDLQSSQNEIRHHRWADVRIIHSKEALLAEYAMACVLRPWDSVPIGYRLAAIYAERYDSRYGTGLIPASASAVEDIGAFWAKHLHVRLPRRTSPKRTIKAKAGGSSSRRPARSK